ncbi:MAG: 3-hydroxyacyl-ACP dehydratase FabZ [Desulfovibrionaceae bacterium]|nr:3-hydroxyacyl-ACP dehydratase FabZ [Desulfovibrionaceae bacterium]
MTSENSLKTTLPISRILQLLPHRYPFLLVDRVDNIIEMDKIWAHKNVTFNEPFFLGHFPGVPVMPGVLIVEAMAQAGGILILQSLLKNAEEVQDKLFLFTSMEHVRFRRQIVPGDRLDLECRLIRHRLKLWKMEGRAFVDGELAAEAELTAAVQERGEML